MTAFAIFTAVVNYGLVVQTAVAANGEFITRHGFFCRHPSFAKALFNETVELWKGRFEHPEDKSLEDALLPLGAMVAAVKSNSNVAFDLIASRPLVENMSAADIGGNPGRPCHLPSRYFRRPLSPQARNGWEEKIQR